jgi:hypothetical protein
MLKGVEWYRRGQKVAVRVALQLDTLFVLFESIMRRKGNGFASMKIELIN